MFQPLSGSARAEPDSARMLKRGRLRDRARPERGLRAADGAPFGPRPRACRGRRKRQRPRACGCRSAMRTGGVEPPQPVGTRLQRAELAGAQRPQGDKEAVARVGFEPTSRAHEAREESRSSTARRARSGRLGSNQRSPVPETGGLPSPLQPDEKGARTRPWRRPGSRRPWNRTTLHRRIRAAPAQPARRRRIEASPGTRTLLHGLTTRGLAV
jgi:hypothetical protein